MESETLLLVRRSMKSLIKASKLTRKMAWFSEPGSEKQDKLVTKSAELTRISSLSALMLRKLEEDFGIKVEDLLPPKPQKSSVELFEEMVERKRLKEISAEKERLTRLNRPQEEIDRVDELVSSNKINVQRPPNPKKIATGGNVKGKGKKKEQVPTFDEPKENSWRESASEEDVYKLLEEIESKNSSV